MRDQWARLSTAQKVGIGAAVVVGAPIFIAGMVSGARDSAGGDKAGAAPAASHGPRPAGHAGTPSRQPAAEPTFTYPGDPECAITYRDRGDGSMSWTAKVTVAGELITHAASPPTGEDPTGMNRRDVQVSPGSTSFTVQVPLTKITDIGGNLQTASGPSYGCSVQPDR